jgi:predicted dienelactone hydrolase
MFTCVRKSCFLIVSLTLVGQLGFADDKPEVKFKLPQSCAVGFQTGQLTYVAKNGEARQRDLFYWYPTTSKEHAINYKGQRGFAAEKGDIAPGKHPVILFSHGFFGAGDQTIFLCESLARAGYVVIAPNHADAIQEALRKKIDIPNFADAKTWDDAKHFDRKEDCSAILDQLDPASKQKLILTGHVDPKKIAAMGHSLGGYTVLGLSGARHAWKEPRIKAAVLYSPYALPYIGGDKLRGVQIPTLMQGGTLDFGITPFLPPIYRNLATPKYYLVLKNETHFGWTNLIALGKTTTTAVEEGNAKWMFLYTLAFLECHLQDQPASVLLTSKNTELWSYQFDVK